MNPSLNRSLATFLLLVVILAPATLHAQAKKTSPTIAMEGVRVGMTEKEVLAMIKEPTDKEKTYLGDYWHYDLPVMTVMFSKKPVVVETLTTKSPLTKVTVDGKKIRVGNKLTEVVDLIGHYANKFVVNKDLTEYIWFNESLRLLCKKGVVEKITVGQEIVFE